MIAIKKFVFCSNRTIEKINISLKKVFIRILCLYESVDLIEKKTSKFVDLTRSSSFL